MSTSTVQAPTPSQPFEVRIERINTYAYMCMAPKDAPPEMAMKTMAHSFRLDPEDGGTRESQVGELVSPGYSSLLAHCKLNSRGAPFFTAHTPTGLFPVLPPPGQRVA
jgi:hypothetical protein